MPEIKEHKAGTRIAEPGIYSNIDLEEYHGDLCLGPSISSSGLRKIENESPAHYWAESPLNPKRGPKEDKKTLNIGQALHALILGEDHFHERFVVRPSKFSDYRSNAAKEWKAGVIAESKVPLTMADVEIIGCCAHQLANEPLVESGILDGLVEHSLIWKDQETGIWLKARPDTLNLHADSLVDVKTIASADQQSCQRAIADHGYHMQLALAAEGIEILLGRAIPNDGFLLIFVEKEKPFLVNLKPLSAEAIYRGRQLNRRAIRKFADCLEKDYWPGYPDSGTTADLPYWLAKRLESEDEAGLLPKVEFHMKERAV